MASSKGAHGAEKSPNKFFEPSRNSAVSNSNSSSSIRQRRQQLPDQPQGKHVRLHPPSPTSRSPASSIYLGSYGHGTTARSRSSLRASLGSAPASPRMSISSAHVGNIWQDLDPELDTYGMEELRDGFFDANFQKAPNLDHEEIRREAERTLPADLRRKRSLGSRNLFLQELSDLKKVFWNVTTTRAGIKLTKSFLAFFITYVICLIPTSREWLGRYNYVMVVSSILNHPGRPIGAQLDGAVLTVLGTVTGLGWGALALWVSTSTVVAQNGYGGILATFMVFFIAASAALRSYYMRLYQFALCAGISIGYTCLADTSSSVSWGKLFDYGIPWLFGQAICLLICCTIFPDAGARPLAVTLHSTFEVLLEGLNVPRQESLSLHRRLAHKFVSLSIAYRDLALDISVTRFNPSDVESLRNLMQSVIRSLLALKVETRLFDDFKEQKTIPQDQSQIVQPKFIESEPSSSRQTFTESSHHNQEIVVDIDPPLVSITRTKSERKAVALVASKLSEPTKYLLECSSSALARCDAVLMNMSGYRKYLGPPASISSNVTESLTQLHVALQRYDAEEASLLANPALPPTYSDHPGVVELFLFVRPVRQAAGTVEALLAKVNGLQKRNQGWRLYLPSYPFSKALKRTNATVRHDRGGVTAGFFFHSQNRLKEAMKGMANVYKPLPRNPKLVPENDNPAGTPIVHTHTIGKYQEEEEFANDPTSSASTQQKIRYRIWKVLHRLQGFETKFALKAVLVTSLLSIPAWLPQSRGWWNRNESWWTVVVAWAMLHPRVGGNFQDLLTRASCAFLGAAWGGFSYAAGGGNPYVMALFAVIYMIPMIYRFTQSSHPRSGIVGCLSFVVVSLGAKAVGGQPSIFQIAWTRGVAFLVGIVAAVVLNWLLWPFVARHELRKALSAMLVYSSVIYRGVVAKYIYYGEGQEPGEADIARSEMLEGRLREGFVRIQQLLALTHHEIRLRGPFNPTPHSALITSLEQFFEYLVSIRQSSLFFHPHYLPSSTLDATDPNPTASQALLSYRRDAVAVILMNLYILAGALSGGRKVPRYLPSAAAARRRLLRKMDEVEDEQVERAKRMAEACGLEKVESEESKRKWSQIYAYSYSQSLTGCVKELEQLQRYTKVICGEQGFDPVDLFSAHSDQEEDTGQDGGLGFGHGDAAQGSRRGGHS